MTSTSASVSKIGGTRLVYRVLPTPQSAVTRASVAEAVRILEKRAAQLGVPQAQIRPAGTKLISIGLPNNQNAHRVEQLVGTTARLEFYDWEANALTPSGKTVAQLLQTQDPSAVAISQGGGPGPGAAGAPGGPGGPGAGSMGLYQAVSLAAKQPEQISRDNARAGSEYFMFGAPGSAACATAAREQHTAPIVGEHCYVAGPQDTLSDLYASLPTGVTASQGKVLIVQQGTTVLHAVPSSFSNPPAWSDPNARFFVLKDRVSLFGSDIANPQQSTAQPAAAPDVAVGFTSKGQTEFQTLTAQVAHRGVLVSGLGQTYDQHFAVALDTQLITVPLIDFRAYPDGIPGNTGAAIFGAFTITSARNLATQLRLGELPVRLTLIAEKTIPPGG